MNVRVGLVDSGISDRHRVRTAALACFGPGAPSPETGDDGSDRLGHGSALADVLLADPRVELAVARVFGASLHCTPAQVAAALDWLVAQRASVVTLAVGLREDRAPLRASCERALAAGVTLVAAVPARGEVSFPARYPGVLRATGDARCAPGEFSYLGTHADFGAHVRAGAVVGASAGCARVAARLASLCADGQTPAAALLQLRKSVRYEGPESRASDSLGRSP
jgi:hypothetical protein